jgi:hypothetical protein
VAYLLKARNVKAGETSIVGEQHDNTWLGAFYADRTTFPQPVTHATMEELLEAVFSMRLRRSNT